MNQEQKKRMILLDVITNGLIYRPIVKWYDDCDEPYVGYEERSEKTFSSISELANAMRQLADELEK